MSSVLSTFSPCDWGVPGKFREWRKHQAEIVEQILQSKKRFVAVAAPTGLGKSLAYMMALAVKGERGCILTSTKGLQTQVVNDFRDIGAQDIRGRANYICKDYPGCNCDEAAPKCECDGMSCTYKLAYAQACAAQIPVTNYAYWMNVGKYAKGGSSGALCTTEKHLGTTCVVNPFQYLILDEAHNADKELSSFLHIDITLRELHDVLGEDIGYFNDLDAHSKMKDWQSWARKAAADVGERVESLKEAADSSAELKLLKRMTVLAGKLEMIAKSPEKGWVVDAIKARGLHSQISGYQFDPVWPAQYAEQFLFRGVPKVVLISATLRPKTLDLLGVDDSEYDFKEYPFIFDRKRCPIYWIPTVRMNFRTSEMEKRTWVRTIDGIIGARLDRKGIVHVPSFTLQRYFLQHTEHSGVVMHNDTSWGADEELRTAKVLERFLGSKAPRVLVSPSLSTGYDFSGSACEYQVIGKLPFPDMQSKAMQERKNRDRGYASYLAMQSLVQASGRAMRFPEDRAETFIVDDSVGWFMNQNRLMAPNWFRMQRVEGKIPEPPPALADES
jgi:Rad3-related DNA helicase